MGTGWSGGDRSRSGARGRWSPGFWSQGTDDQPNHALTGLQSKQHSRQTNQAGTPNQLAELRVVRVLVPTVVVPEVAAGVVRGIGENQVDLAPLPVKRHHGLKVLALY